MTSYRSVLVALVLTVVGSDTALPQTSAGGSIRGHVRDEQNAVLPGVSVMAVSSTVPTQFEANTDAEGFYRLLDLPPGTYTVTAELPGFARIVRENLVMRAGLNLGLDLVLKVGSVAESVTVTADAPMLESQGSGQTINVDGDFQRSLALSTRRNWSDFMLLTPGVVTTLATGTTNMYSHGSNVGSHVFQLDGADVSPSALGSPVYSYMSSEVLEDVQIRTAGAEASVPLGQGAIVSMVSRAGSDVFGGAGVILWQQDNWSANNNPGGTTSAFTQVQPDISVGGPIKKGRAWFFGSHRYTHLDEAVSRTPAQLATLRSLVPSFDPQNAKRQVNASFVKVNTQLTPRHQLLAFYERSQQKADSLIDIEEKSFTKLLIGGPAVAVRLTSILGDGTIMRAGGSYNNLTNPSELNTYSEPARIVHRSAFMSTGRLVGSGAIARLGNRPSAQEGEGEKVTFTFDISRYQRGWLGSHELGAGLYLQPVRRSGFPVRYPVGPNGVSEEELVLQDQDDITSDLIPFRRRIYESDQSIFRRTSASDYAFYLQDSWKPRPRLTISAGLRVDRIRVTDELFDVPVLRTTAVGPRLGANYLLTQDGRNTVRTSWGRVHDAVSSAMNQAAGQFQTGWRDEYDLDLDGSFETVFVTPTLNSLVLNRQFDLDEFRQPHVDEWMVGYQRQLPGLVGVDVSVIHRSFKNLTTSVEVNGLYEGSVFRGYRDESFNEIFRVTSNVWNQRVFTALQLQATKHSDRLQALASYVRQWRRVSGTFQPNDPALFIQPEAFPNDRGIGDGRFASTNSLSGADSAANENIRDHVFRAAVTYLAPWRLKVATSALVMSGVWSGPIVTRLPAADPSFGPPTVRLSTGRVVSNPLATPIRFAFPTRGEGQTTSPWVTEWNLRIGREFRAANARIEPSLDTLNLLNAGHEQAFFRPGANQLYSPNFGTLTQRQPPRSFQVTVRVTF